MFVWRFVRVGAPVLVLGLGSGCSSNGTSKGDAGGGDGSSATGTCAKMCPQVLSAQCANGPPDEASCETGCNAEQTKCPNEFATVSACATTYSCDASKAPSPTGCSTEYAALVACYNGSSSQACAQVCPAVVAAKCAMGPPDEASCESGCATEQTKCPNEFAAMLACAGSTPTFVCAASGLPEPQGCDAQATALATCAAK